MPAECGRIPRRLSENGYFSQSLRQTQIIILEILQCIPVVIIFAFLDLEKTISLSDSLLELECKRHGPHMAALKVRNP